jgi:hypothetical protein
MNDMTLYEQMIAVDKSENNIADFWSILPRLLDQLNIMEFDFDYDEFQNDNRLQFYWLTIHKGNYRIAGDCVVYLNGNPVALISQRNRFDYVSKESKQLLRNYLFSLTVNDDYPYISDNKTKVPSIYQKNYIMNEDSAYLIDGTKVKIVAADNDLGTARIIKPDDTTTDVEFSDLYFKMNLSF